MLNFEVYLVVFFGGGGQTGHSMPLGRAMALNAPLDLPVYEGRSISKVKYVIAHWPEAIAESNNYHVNLRKILYKVHLNVFRSST